VTHQQLLEVIADQNSLLVKDSFLPRYDKFRQNDSEQLITIITGIRRCGKSTLLNEIRTLRSEKDYYLNFDDDRLIGFNVSDFQLLTELFMEKFGKQKTYYFDEIQNISGWERYIRRLHDQGNKVYITGSNARMLSRELGTHLTGRYIQSELYPFSFREFAAFKQISYNEDTANTTEGKALFRRIFSEYFESGGIPEYLKTGNKDYLKNLYDGILYRDILTRHNLTKEKEIKELLYFIAGNISKEVTQNSLAKIIGIKNSTTIKDYLSYFEDSYLVFTLLKYDDSIKRQLLAPRKVYFIDNALAGSISFRHNYDFGRFLENIVFLELKRKGGELFYFKRKNECDFIHKDRTSAISAIQVCHDTSVNLVKEREIAGLLEALHYFSLEKGIILTITEEDELKAEGKTIALRPIWKWLMAD
jgi:predicted AAA+ superfamily ATPase